MTALVLDAPARRHHRVPWSPRAWSQAFYLTGGIPALLAVPILVLLPELAAGLRPRWLLPFLFTAVALLASPLLTRLHRHRLSVTAGLEIPPQPPIPNGLSRTGILTAARTGTTWRQLGYHFLAAPRPGRRGHHRVRHVAGGPAVHAGVRLRLSDAPSPPTRPPASRSRSRAAAARSWSGPPPIAAGRPPCQGRPGRRSPLPELSGGAP